jgi:hypothetical protein
MRSPSAHAPYAASASAERALTGSLLAPSWSPRVFGAGAAASGDDSVGRIGGRVARLGVGGAGADVAIVVCRSDAASFLLIDEYAHPASAPAAPAAEPASVAGVPGAAPALTAAKMFGGPSSSASAVSGCTKVSV